MAGEPIFTYTEDFTDTHPPRIGYTNPPGIEIVSMKCYITYSKYYDEGVVAVRDLDPTKNEYTFTFTDAELTKLYTLNDMHMYLDSDIDFVLESRDTNNYPRYTVKTRHFRIDTTGAAPAYMNPTVVDGNDDTIALTGNARRIIDGLNKTYVSVTPMPRKGAIIESENVVVSYYDQEFKMDPTGEYLGYFDNLLSIDGAKPKIALTITDSRGLVTTSTISPLGFIKYVPPTLTANVYVETPEGETILKVRAHVEGEIINEEWASTGDYNRVHVDYRVDVNGAGFSDWINGDSYIHYQNHTDEDPTIKYHTFPSSTTADILCTTVTSDKTVTVELRVYDIDVSRAVYYSQTISIIPTFDWSKSDFNFNVPVNIPGFSTEHGHGLSIGHVPMTDFVKETGTDGDWSYRKWNSGITECWCVTTGSVTLASQVDGFYQKVVTVNYPFTFSEPPTVFVDGGSSSHLDIARTFGVQEAARAKFNILGLNAHTAEYSVSVYAIGKI